MVFENENTWYKAVQSRREEEFHRKYEEAADRVRKEFGAKHPNYIDGKPVYSSEGDFPDVSPVDTKIVVGYFQKGTREDAKKAIQAAKAAFAEWSQKPYAKRVSIFRNAADKIREKKFELAALMSYENGKNRFEAVADVDEAIDLISYYCEQMEVNKGFTKEMGGAFPNEQARSVLKPYGVWGVIAPFNFPLALAAGMSAGAVLTGNTAVFKPATDTPFLGLKLYESLISAGVPPGAYNYVAGPGDAVGRELVENPDVAGIVFTGSRDVGVSSLRQCLTKSLKPFIAEMGGKNPAIVTSKADLDKAVEGIYRAAFGFGGQKCSACSRVYIEKTAKKDFLDRLLAKTRETKIGDPLQRGVFLGPLINQRALNNYSRYMETAKKDGGRILVGGNILKEGGLKDGYYVEPSIVDGLPENHPFFREELFVPILFIAEVDSLDEAISEANKAEYGLTAGIFSEDPKEIQYFFDKIEAGVTYANRKIGATTGAMGGVQSFCGWKYSGSSGKGGNGPYYVQQFMREQSQSTYK